MMSVSGRGVAPGKPRLATNPANKTSFGAASADRSLTLQIFNVGTADLQITAIDRTGSSDFSLDPAPTLPLTIAAGAESDVTIKYHPTSNGDAKAEFKITATDSATAHEFDVSGTGVNISSSNWVTVLEYIGVGLLVAGAVVGGVVIAEKLSQKKGA